MYAARLETSIRGLHAYSSDIKAGNNVSLRNDEEFFEKNHQASVEVVMNGEGVGHIAKEIAKTVYKHIKLGNETSITVYDEKVTF